MFADVLERKRLKDNKKLLEMCLLASKGDKIFIDKDISIYNENYINLLKVVIARGDDTSLDNIKRIMDVGVNINRVVGNASPLLVAAYRAKLEQVKLLLENGANVNIKNKSGMNALMFACMGDPMLTAPEFIFGKEKEFYLMKSNINNYLYKAYSSSKKRDRFNVAKHLLEQGIEPNHVIEKRNYSDIYTFLPLTALDIYMGDSSFFDKRMINLLLKYKVLNNYTPGYFVPENYDDTFDTFGELVPDYSGRKNLENKARYLARKK